MGNPRTPTPLKVVRGTTRKDRANPDEPVLVVAQHGVRPPPWLKLSPLARRAWHDLVPLLRGMEVMTEADRTALALLCESLADYRRARDQVNAEGATYETTNEQGGTMIRKHPAVEIGGQAAGFAKAMLGEFGLTPAARAKVSKVGAARQSPLAKWMSGEGTGS